MQRVRAAGRREPTVRGLEALLAASLMHVEPGDFVRSFTGSPAAASFAAERLSVTTEPATPLPPAQRLAVIAGVAQGLQMAKDSRLAVYYCAAGPATARTETGWAEALAYAAKARVPLIVICADVATSRRRTAATGKAAALTSETMAKLAAPMKLPVLPVDGTDAVAVYRVMQESVLRARTLGGAAVIWCSLPAPAPDAADPLRHMRRYLADRKLLPVSLQSTGAGRSTFSAARARKSPVRA